MGVLLADVPILSSLTPTPWWSFSQTPDYSQYGKQKHDYQHVVAPVFAITQPSPLYVEGDFLFLILHLSYRNFTRFGKISSYRGASAEQGSGEDI